MAKAPATPPQMNISITTAIKAGFFGAIGFFVAQLLIVPVILLLMLICGISLAGLGLAASKAAQPANSPTAQTTTTTRWQPRTPAPTGGYAATR